MKRTFISILAALLFITGGVARADVNSTNLELKLKGRIDEAIAWASSPEIVAAVRKSNEEPSSTLSPMTQEKWSALESDSNSVTAFTVNPVGKYLRTLRSAVLSEAFVNNASGKKVGFLGKPTNWCHQGKPKHEIPMSGKVWRGPIEFDESSGTKEVQVAVPVLDNGKPIGSLVVGLNIFEIAIN